MLDERRELKYTPNHHYVQYCCTFNVPKCQILVYSVSLSCFVGFERMYFIVCWSLILMGGNYCEIAIFHIQLLVWLH